MGPSMVRKFQNDAWTQAHVYSFPTSFGIKLQQMSNGHFKKAMNTLFLRKERRFFFQGKRKEELKSKNKQNNTFRR